MNRRHLGIRALHWASIFTSIAALALSTGDSAASGESQPVFEPPQPHTHCNSPKTPKQPIQRFLLIVSTIDGKISALNVGNGGSVEWSMDAGKGPLLSSSISRLEMMRNGVLTRLIPSLDGALYSFDDEGFEPLPFTADSLLSSSFKFSEDSSVVGGKESESYGVDVSSGEIRYICSLGGCLKYKGKSNKSKSPSGDVLVIQRNQKTVRAVELRSGDEKWNFSVGTHDVSYLKEKIESRANIESSYDEEGIRIDSDSSDDWTASQESDLDIDLKVIVPSGTVVAVRKSNAAYMMWKHQFDTPIARAWTLKNGELGEMSLFDDRHIPALASGEEYPTEYSIPPLLYVGIHQSQLYVQPSVNLATNVKDLVIDKRSKKMPKIKWRPYLASSPSRTPALIADRQYAPSWQPPDDPQDSRAVQLLQETEYPYDNGYYLIPDICSMELEAEDIIMNKSEINQNDDWTVTVTLWNWWKEVVLISVCTSIIVHLILSRYSRGETKVITESETKERSVGSESEKSSEKNVPVDYGLQNVTNPEDYKSRYLEDFDQQMCLGKGGFGVVFEAKNRLDDCSYAIKRIALPNCEKSKKKKVPTATLR